MKNAVCIKAQLSSLLTQCIIFHVVNTLTEIFFVFHLQRNRRFALLSIVSVLWFCCQTVYAQQTPYERNGKNYTATYEECIHFYRQLDKDFETVSLVEMGMTDAGVPLHLVLLNAGANFDPKHWHRSGQVVLLINNGIHPGEPDGIDASMMLVRDLAKKDLIPDHVSLAFIPVYNIGGCLNRSEFNRVDQNGPEAFGSRGNSQNLDLNRDFIKCDSREARSFAELFQWINPDIFLDNHVSDGADYPYVMTMATSQYQKLGGVMGDYLHDVLEPALFHSMAKRGNAMIPYVNAWGHDAKEGWSQFFDSPRYSTGYATLFHTFGFTPETHMLKPYPQRVEATYQFMEVIIEYANQHADSIKSIRQKAIQNCMQQTTFPISWKIDDNKYTEIDFKGYTYKSIISEVSGLPVHYYDRNDPYEAKIQFKDQFKPNIQIKAPDAYIIPQGWWKVIELLKVNGVETTRLPNDSIISVEAYRITEAKSGDRAYEGHHAHTVVKTERQKIRQAFRKGDYVVPLTQPRKRFIIEVLEPEATDAYFVWNFFDAILIQKEGYSDYAYESYAAEYLKAHPSLAVELKKKRDTDSSFASNAAAQLDFVFKHSPYYEKGHNLYPIFRLTTVNEMPLKNAETELPTLRNKQEE